MPEELHESVEAVAEYLGPMTKEEVNETMDMIRTMSQQVVDEMDRETLWRCMTTIRLKSILEEQGSEAFIEHSDYEMNRFLKQYEEGMELGGWQEVADALYTRIKTEENQSVFTTP